MEDKDLEAIANKARDKVMEQIYAEIGKSFIRKIFWIMVAVIIGAGVFFGVIHLPKVN